MLLNFDEVNLNLPNSWNMIYFFIRYLEPNTATANHFLGIIAAFKKASIPCKLVVMSPSRNFKEINEIDKFDFIPLYSPFRHGIGTKCLNHVLTSLEHHYKILSMRNYRRFLNLLSPSDSVFAYGADEQLDDLIKTGAKIYQERTEHPDVSSYMNQRTKEIYFQNIKKLTGLFVISTSLRDYYIKNGVKDDRIHILNMMVDPSRFEFVSKQKVDFPYIAYCGTASNTKDGVDCLIKAFSIVSNKFPLYKLMIIGSVPEKREENCNIRLINDLNLTNKVILTGKISASEIPQLLTNADILALARPNNKQAKNGFPTKLGEYLMTGNPVVITDTGDISLFLKNKESAYIVEPDNPEAFADSLIYAIEHKNESSLVGEKGRNVGLENFNCWKESRKVIRILNDSND